MTHHSFLRKQLSALGFDKAVLEGRHLDAAEILNHHPAFHESLIRVELLQHQYQFSPKFPTIAVVEPFCFKERYYLSLCLMFSISHMPNDHLAIRLMKSVAPDGDLIYQREASVWLGLMALVGRGDYRNDVLAADREAFFWFQKGVELENPDAMFYLGLMYRHGRGIGEAQLLYSEQSAFSYFSQAAQRGHLDACSALAAMYKQGANVLGGYSFQNTKTALLWLTKAALENHAESQNNLGVMYLMGEGLDDGSNPINDKKAFFYYSEASSQGLPVACYNLAWMYQQGRGVPASTPHLNDREAVAWFTKASDLGNNDAIRELAWMYQQGRGVANGRCLENYLTAMFWYRRYARAADFSLGWFEQKSLYINNLKIDKVISYADQSLSSDPMILFDALIKAPREAAALILDDIQLVTHVDSPFFQALFESFKDLAFFERWCSSEIAIKYIEKLIDFLKGSNYKELLASQYFHHILGFLGQDSKKRLFLFTFLSATSANELLWMLHDIAYAYQANPDPFGRGIIQVITRHLFFVAEQCVELLTRDMRYLLANFFINIIGWQQSFSMRLDSGAPEKEQLLELLRYARHYYKTPKLAEREWCSSIEQEMKSLGLQLLTMPKKSSVGLSQVELRVTPVTKKRRL